MEFLGLLTVGLFLGMSHAMEADHLAAVSSMWRSQNGRYGIFQRTLYWGAGHGLTLMLLCSILLITGNQLSATTENLMELAVAILVIGLGAQLIYRLRRDKIHFHVHEHDGHRHLHAHSHRHDPAPTTQTLSHADMPHQHKHPKKRPFGALFIGIMHGAAGSAGLMVLVMTATHSLLLSLLYVAVFSIGTVIGMTALTFVVFLPLSKIGLWATRFNYGLSLVIACACFLAGGMLAYEKIAALLVI